ncbi:MAG TPA: hypothetical protein VGW74_17360, partial [Propionibacteriaceae bacterium]|nr:hypothetical protein [Propionibacteriaceae bacterium]
MRPSGGTRTRPRWLPIPPKRPAPFTSERPWPGGRHAGNEAIRLYRASAEAALRAGDPRRAAVEFATAAELIGCAPGTLAELVPPGEAQALLAEA